MAADPVAGVICSAACGERQVLIAHTSTGLAFDEDGTCDHAEPFGILRIDERLFGPPFTETVLHEWLHERFPELKESVIAKLARQLKDLLYVPEIRRRGFLDYV